MGHHPTGERDAVETAQNVETRHSAPPVLPKAGYSGYVASLLADAIAAQAQAYTPYSHYPVGAALLTRDGQIYTGCNIENAAYPLTICAERVAVFRAVADGQRDFVALAVVTVNGGSPCGSCRQVLREFNAGDLPVFIGTPAGQYRQTTLAELLPDSFGPENLPGTVHS
ncbi:MAG: cytidine deaminase [Anaerolineae bacterium]|nr:cytidine deaminase [Anaerolineae bacterium]